MFTKYPKIYRLWKEEVEWILDWYVYIQEKIDWANTSIWIDNWDLQMGSRTQVIYKNWEKTKDFRGFQEYVLQHKWIMQYLEKNPNHILYWEWLVKHTIQYPPEFLNRFYLFDILNKDTWKFIDTVLVDSIADIFNIDKPRIFNEWLMQKDKIEEFVWKNVRWVAWEWVVIKWEYINKFWDNVYAKIVHDSFKEENNIIFWNHSKHDIEMKFVSSYITPERVRKIVNKIEQNESRSIVIQDTPKVMGMVLYDAFSEEMRGYSWNLVIDMWRLKRLSNSRSRFIFHHYINTGNFLSWFDDIDESNHT